MEQLHICWDLNSLQTPFLSHLHPHESSSFSMLVLITIQYYSNVASFSFDVY
jgi:hypothetical protein